jgi:hypothetical protein
MLLSAPTVSKDNSATSSKLLEKFNTFIQCGTDFGPPLSITLEWLAWKPAMCDGMWLFLATTSNERLLRCVCKELLALSKAA